MAFGLRSDQFNRHPEGIAAQAPDNLLWMVHRHMAEHAHFHKIALADKFYEKTRKSLNSPGYHMRKEGLEPSHPNREQVPETCASTISPLSRTLIANAYRACAMRPIRLLNTFCKLFFFFLSFFSARYGCAIRSPGPAMAVPYTGPLFTASDCTTNTSLPHASGCAPHALSRD